MAWAEISLLEPVEVKVSACRAGGGGTWLLEEQTGCRSWSLDAARLERGE